MTLAISTNSVVTNPLAGKQYIDTTLWNRLVGRIEDDLTFKSHFGSRSVEGRREAAESILDQTVAFLRLISNSVGEPYSPSEKVDIGWHAFLMYTREYADFCQHIAGRMIHHAPSDVPGVDYGTGNVHRTVAAMKVHGMYVDETLWVGKVDCCGVDTYAAKADCGYCTGDSCSGSTCNGE